MPMKKFFYNNLNFLVHQTVFADSESSVATSPRTAIHLLLAAYLQNPYTNSENYPTTGGWYFNRE